MEITKEFMTIANKLAGALEFSPLDDHLTLIDRDDEGNGFVKNYFYTHLTAVLDEVLKDYSYRIYHGATKAVIVIEEFDTVLKLPFNCYEDCYYFSDNLEEDEVLTPERIRELESNLLIFENASFYDIDEDTNEIMETSGNWDYCYSEVTIFRVAQELGFDKYFAETRYLTSNSFGYPIYAQEKVKEYWDYADRPEVALKAIKIEQEISAKVKVHSHIFSEQFVLSLVNKYGENEIIDFINFLSDNDFDGDLHSHNYGFKYDGTPILFDYSCFSE